jgi:hypothetical protein
VGDAYKILIGKPEGKIPLGRPRCRCGIMSKWILRRREGCVDCFKLDQGRDNRLALVNTVMSISVP